MEASTTRGTTALVYWQLHSSLYTGAVQGYWSTPNWSDRLKGCRQVSTELNILWGIAGSLPFVCSCGNSLANVSEVIGKHLVNFLLGIGRYWHSLSNLLHSVTELSIRSNKFHRGYWQFLKMADILSQAGFLVLMKVETVFCSLEVVTYSEPETQKP